MNDSTTLTNAVNRNADYLNRLHEIHHLQQLSLEQFKAHQPNTAQSAVFAEQAKYAMSLINSNLHNLTRCIESLEELQHTIEQTTSSNHLGGLISAISDDYRFLEHDLADFAHVATIAKQQAELIVPVPSAFNREAMQYQLATAIRLLQYFRDEIDRYFALHSANTTLASEV